MYEARSTTSVASDPKRDVLVSLAMAFVTGGFAGGGVSKAGSGLRLLAAAVGRKGVDSAIFGVYDGGGVFFVNDGWN
jgi:hypothetical protein